MYEPRTAKLLPTRPFLWRLARHLLWATAFVGVSLLLGMIGYHRLAHLPWIDAFVNASMLLGGMGPVDTLTTSGAKLFAGLYALYSGLVFIVSAGVIVLPVAHRILHSLHVDDND